MSGVDHTHLLEAINRIGDELAEHRRDALARNREVSDRFASGQVMFATIQKDIAGLRTEFGAELRPISEALKTHEINIDALKAAENIRKGERAALGWLAGSKPVAWLAAVIATAGAWFAGQGAGGAP